MRYPPKRHYVFIKKKGVHIVAPASVSKKVGGYVFAPDLQAPSNSPDWGRTDLQLRYFLLLTELKRCQLKTEVNK